MDRRSGPARLFALVVSTLLFSLPALTQQITGNWQGALDVGGGHQLRLILEISAAPDATYTARLYSIDQGPDPMATDSMTLTGRRVQFAIKGIGGSYDGILQPDDAHIKGTWTQGSPLPLTFERATGPSAWQKDPTPHKISFVPVAPDVRLEVVDWGGTGRAVVLLAGLGNSAHIFDHLAPKLAPDYHVYGITRRGFGESSVPSPAVPANYSADQLGDDVLTVLSALHLDRPILIGHSIAGEELSSIGSRHPDRVAGLVYLDAGFPYALYNEEQGDFLLDLLALRRQLDLLLPGSGTPNTVASLHAAEIALTQFRHDLTVQSEQIAVMPALPAPAPGEPPPPPTPANAIVLGQQRYTSIPVPILAIFAVPHNMQQLYPNDPKALAAAEAYDLQRMTAISDSFEHNVPTAHVVRLQHADHYVFQSNEADVLREIHTFIAALPTAK